MLGHIQFPSSPSMSASLVCEPQSFPSSSTWNRNMQDDMKEAIDLLWKFKAALDKLHPNCTDLVEAMISQRR